MSFVVFLLVAGDLGLADFLVVVGGGCCAIVLYVSGLLVCLWLLDCGGGFDAFGCRWLVSWLGVCGCFPGLFGFDVLGLDVVLVLLIWFLVGGFAFCGLDFLMFGLHSLA